MRIGCQQQLAITVGVDQQRAVVQVVIAPVGTFIEHHQLVDIVRQLDFSGSIGIAAIGHHRRIETTPDKKQLIRSFLLVRILDPERNAGQQTPVVKEAIPRVPPKLAGELCVDIETILIVIAIDHHRMHPVTQWDQAIDRLVMCFRPDDSFHRGRFHLDPLREAPGCQFSDTCKIIQLSFITSAGESTQDYEYHEPNESPATHSRASLAVSRRR